MKVLVACEYSGVVRDAFIARGHDAISCDLLPTERPGPHWEGDVKTFLRYIREDFDLIIAHPPCTYLCNSGVRWLYGGSGSVINPIRWEHMLEGAEFFKFFLTLNARYIAVENPVMHKYAREHVGRGHDFTIQPYEFGHGETKRTCFHTANLPPLIPTNRVAGRAPVVHHASPGPNRWKERSRTYQGIADAMAEQWGTLSL